MVLCCMERDFCKTKLVKMQEPSPLFCAVEDDFFQAGGAVAYPLLLFVFGNALQVVNVLEQVPIAASMLNSFVCIWGRVMYSE